MSMPATPFTPGKEASNADSGCVASCGPDPGGERPGPQRGLKTTRREAQRAENSSPPSPHSRAGHSRAGLAGRGHHDNRTIAPGRRKINTRTSNNCPSPIDYGMSRVPLIASNTDIRLGKVADERKGTQDRGHCPPAAPEPAPSADGRTGSRSAASADPTGTPSGPMLAAREPRPPGHARYTFTHTGYERRPYSGL